MKRIGLFLAVVLIFYLCLSWMLNLDKKVEAIEVETEEIAMSINSTEEKSYTAALVGSRINLYQEPEEQSFVSKANSEVIEKTVYDTATSKYVEELKICHDMNMFYEQVDENSYFASIIVDNMQDYIERHEFYRLVFKTCCNCCKYIDGYIDRLYQYEQIPFNDSDHSYISYLHSMDIIPNTIDENIYPYSNIDREEASLILYNTYNFFREIPGDKLLIADRNTSIKDYSHIDERYKRSLLFSNQINLIEMENDCILPDKDMTYEEALICCYRLYNTIIEHVDTVDPLYSNETNCYRLIRYYGEFNNAVVAGIIANIASESGHTFDPDIHQYGGGPGYGICQWTASSRKQGLYDYAEVCGYNYDTLECQCQYLIYELETLTPKLLKYLNEVPDTSDGAYNAGYQFCLIFEAPRDLEACCLSRANNAIKYFDQYNKYQY